MAGLTSSKLRTEPAGDASTRTRARRRSARSTPWLLVLFGAMGGVLAAVGFLLGQRPTVEHVELRSIPRLLPLGAIAILAPALAWRMRRTSRPSEALRFAGRVGAAVTVATGVLAAGLESYLARADSAIVFVTVIAMWIGSGMWATAMAQLAIGPAFDHVSPTPRSSIRRDISSALTAASLMPVALTGAGVVLRVGPVDTPLIVYVCTVAALAIGSTALALRYLRRDIIRPIEALSASLSTVREGNLDVAIDVSADNELGALQQISASMIADLRTGSRLRDHVVRLVSKPVLDWAVDDDLTPQRREITVLFFDLVGFTSLAERNDPETVVGLLQQVFDIVVRAVEANNGVVNKFVGDAVLGVFGAPRRDADRELHAVSAACAIATAMDATLPDLGFGVGIGSGPVVAGAVGATTRFEYGVIGEPVNRAERLQELTREVSGRMLCDEVTAAAVPTLTARLGSYVLRRATKPTEVFAVGAERLRS